MVCSLLRLPTLLFPVGLAVSSLIPLGCQASVSANASTSRPRADSEEGPDFDKPITAKELAATAAPPPPVFDMALLGARHDLSLIPAQANAMCACVKAGLGAAQSAAFQWEGSAPHLSDDTQLAFAISSENVPCAGEPKGSAGASYWGYRISGNDVIVFVEGAKEGRPRTTAAIIPKPVNDGQVYLAPAKKKQPYGRALDGKSDRCKVGNAATKRSTPFSASELGNEAPVANVPSVDGVE